MPTSTTRSSAPAHCLIAALLATIVCATACSTPKRAVRAPSVPIVRDIPQALLGTIGAEATLGGIQSQLVSGYGIVVGLNGTGGGEIPAAVRTTMERQLARGGIGRGGTLERGPMAGKSVDQVLRDPNIAVVVVQAAIAPGLPEGATFDVIIRALPGTATTSLEGGKLWTTELRLGPPTPFGGVRTRAIAQANGPIFVNPFEEPGSGGVTGPRRTVGRVLGGGVVKTPLRLDLRLDNPSHARARAMVAAINSRFQRGPRDDGPVASGRDNASIAIRIPAKHRDDPVEFLQLLLHTRVNLSFPEQWAQRYVEELRRQPALEKDLSWCLQALGPAAIPSLSKMYDYGELAPRLGALRAGAKLGDPRTIPHLLDLAREAPPTVRSEATLLLSTMPADPRINLGLRAMLDDRDMEVRIAAYEALQQRRDPIVQRRPVGRLADAPNFVLDQVPSEHPMVYVTQEGEARIALFGAPKFELDPGRVVSAWSDRFMLTSWEGGGSGADRHRPQMWYKDHRSGAVTKRSIDDDVSSFIVLAGHRSSPENPDPGLGLTYGEVVGLLYEVQQQDGYAGGFATQRDRLMGQLLDAAAGAQLADRPENDVEQPEAIWTAPTISDQPWTAPTTEEDSDRPMIVPLETDVSEVDRGGIDRREN